MWRIKFVSNEDGEDDLFQTEGQNVEDDDNDSWEIQSSEDVDRENNQNSDDDDDAMYASLSIEKTKKEMIFMKAQSLQWKRKMLKSYQRLFQTVLKWEAEQLGCGTNKISSRL